MSDQNKIVSIENSNISREITGMRFTKNFRSATAEEWYVFIPGFKDPVSGGAAGKAIIHYNLFGNKEIFINTTVIFDDPDLHEIVNVLVGYADTLLSVHSGNNSYQAEYRS